jgi:hypothetical protein
MNVCRFMGFPRRRGSHPSTLIVATVLRIAAEPPMCCCACCGSATLERSRNTGDLEHAPERFSVPAAARQLFFRVHSWTAVAVPVMMYFLAE